MLKSEAIAARDVIMDDPAALAVATCSWDSGALNDLSSHRQPIFGRKRKVILVEIHYATQIPDRNRYRAIHRVGLLGVWFRSKKNADAEFVLRMIPWTQVTSVVLHERTDPPPTTPAP